MGTLAGPRRRGDRVGHIGLQRSKIKTGTDQSSSISLLLRGRALLLPLRQDSV